MYDNSYQPNGVKIPFCNSLKIENVPEKQFLLSESFLVQAAEFAHRQQFSLQFIFQIIKKGKFTRQKHQRFFVL
jgi:hypothetical protein